jgi:hypothetical protein
MKPTARTPRLDHDEPIIADNSPARFNFGTELDEVDGKNFKRKYTSFKMLSLVLVSKTTGSVTTEEHALAPESTITFDLVNSASKTEQITFVAKNEEIKVKAKTNNLKKNPKLKHVMESETLADLRFSKITFTRPGGQDQTLPSGGGAFDSASVLAVIKATPHTN